MASLSISCVLESGNQGSVGALRTLAARGRSGSCRARVCTGDALLQAQLSMRRVLRPHAEAAGRCACALRVHTICALSQCAGLWRAGCERWQCGGTELSGTQSRPGDGGSVTDRVARLRAANAADKSWGRNRKTRVKTGRQWVRPYGRGRRRTGGSGPAGAEKDPGQGWRRPSRGAVPGLEWAVRIQDPRAARAGGRGGPGDGESHRPLVPASGLWRGSRPRTRARTGEGHLPGRSASACGSGWVRSSSFGTLGGRGSGRVLLCLCT